MPLTDAKLYLTKTTQCVELCLLSIQHRQYSQIYNAGSKSKLSVACSVLSLHYVRTDYKIAEWPPFGKELLTRLTVCSLV